MRDVRSHVGKLAEEPYGSLHPFPYSINDAIRKNINLIRASENLPASGRARRKFILAGIVAALGAGTLAVDFLYGGPIRSILYPQNSTRGQQMTSLTELLTETTSEVFSTSSKTYPYSGRFFFDSGTSTFGTEGDGIQNDSDIEQGESNAQALFVDTNFKPAGTVPADSSGDVSIDLPKGNYTIYPVINNPDRTYGYMCQSVDDFRAISAGYPINVSENNPKAYFGLMQGWLAHPLREIDPNRGYYYDRDPRKGYVLAWNGNTEYSEDQNAGTHFQAEWGDDVPAFAPGIVEKINFPNNSPNWVIIQHEILGGKYFETWYAHSSKILVEPGQKVSRFQPIAKVGTTGCGGCGGQPIIHFGLSDYWHDNSGNKVIRDLDPYKPIYPFDTVPYGCWSVDPYPTGNYDWWFLPGDDVNWKNYWIVENQTLYGPPYS